MSTPRPVPGGRLPLPGLLPDERRRGRRGCSTPRPGGRAVGTRSARRPTATSTSRSPPAGSRSKGTCTCPSPPRAWSSSPTGAAAAATARGTGSWPRCSTRPVSAPCCSTCSRPRRRATGPRCSTSSCSAGRLRGRHRLAAGPAPTRRSAGSGYFGASTGAAAALLAAAASSAPTSPPSCPAAVAPTWPAPRLGEVQAPTLLIVGSDDEVVLDLNRQAQAQLRCPSDLAVVEGATHLFEEPGTLAEAAHLASRLVQPVPAAARRRRPRDRGGPVSPARGPVRRDDASAQIRSLARPLSRAADLDRLVDAVGSARFVCLGEASHGTHEYYRLAGPAQPAAHRGARLHLDRGRG